VLEQEALRFFYLLFSVSFKLWYYDITHTLMSTVFVPIKLLLLTCEIQTTKYEVICQS